jgi:hypothetical protein
VLADPAATTRVLVLTTFDLDDYVYAALRVGASGFLLKDAPPWRTRPAWSSRADERDYSRVAQRCSVGPAMQRRDQSRRSRRPEELDRRRPDEQPVRSETANRVLALQRSAGNQAVSALLARSPDGATEEKDKTESAGASGVRATLPGIGTIPLLSFSAGATGRPPGGSAGRGREDEKAPTVREMVFSSRVGEHSSKLFKATIDGKPMEVEVIVPRGKSTLRLKLKGAIVSNYSTSGAGGEGDSAIESWTLNFESVEQSSEGE